MSTLTLERECKPTTHFRFSVNIEGSCLPWPVSIITTEQIIELGGWDPSLGVIQIDEENNEKTLAPGTVIELTPGLAFCKKVRWKRG